MERINGFHFNWLGREIKCPNKFQSNLTYKYYSGCVFGEERYYIGSGVVVRHHDKILPGCIHYFLEDLLATSKIKKYIVCLELFHFPKDIIDEIRNPIKFTCEKEILKNEKLTLEFVPIEDIFFPCTIIFGLVSETPEEIIEESKTSDLTYVCRYIVCRRRNHFVLKAAVAHQVNLSDDEDDDVEIISDNIPKVTTITTYNPNDNNSRILVNNPTQNILEINIIHNVNGVNIQHNCSEILPNNVDNENENMSAICVSRKEYCITDFEGEKDRQLDTKKEWNPKVKTSGFQAKLPVVLLTRLSSDIVSSLNLNNCEKSPTTSELKENNGEKRRSTRISAIKYIDKSVKCSTDKPKRKYRRRKVKNDKTVKRKGRRRRTCDVKNYSNPYGLRTNGRNNQEISETDTNS